MKNKKKRKQNVYKRKRDLHFLRVIPTCLFSAVLVAFFAIIGYSVAKPFGNVGEAKPQALLDIEEILTEPATEENISDEMKAYWLPEAEINDMETLERMLNRIGKSYNVAVIPMKIKGGRLNYDSDVEGAEAAGADASLEISEIIDAVREYGYKPAASFNMLSDNLYPKADNSAGFVYKKGGKLWFDAAEKNGGKAWLSPSSASSGVYLSSLTSEIADAGFEYIIATDVEYPKFSRLGLDDIGELVTNENRYLDLIDIVNKVSSSVSAKGREMWIEIPAFEMFGGTYEVFQPLLLETQKTVLKINLDDFKSTVKCKDENIDFSKMTVAEKVEKICSIAETFIYKTSFIPEITGSNISSSDKKAAVEALKNMKYYSYIVR